MNQQRKIITTIIIAFLFFSYGCHSQQLTNSKLTDLKKAIAADKYPNIDGIVVSKNNKILIEEYFNGFKKNSQHDTRSSFKSVTSILAGIAIDQGLFHINDNLDKFFPEWKNDDRGKITVKNLLEMKSGLQCEGFFDIGPDCESEMWDTKDWIGFILDIPLRHQPGLNWAYTSVEPMLVGELIARTSESTIMDFAKEYLFEPLKIEQYKWTISPKGRGMSAGSFFMRPLDMIKISQLVNNKGTWDGKKIVSKEWIEKSTLCQIDVEMSFVRFSRTRNAKYTTAKYGYFWYREKLQYGDIKTEVLFASGNGGQYMMVLKDYDAEIVFTGSNYGNWRGKLPFKILLKYLIPILENEQ
ncbi:MAG: beta-lactamase family protein [Flammeovirgaceae bacterium]|nr:beta-lactamase family protein [Flammeovirgaceae bacterium]